MTEEQITKPKIQLNESQQIVLQNLIDWSHTTNKEDLLATLKGSAGTGKTTITNEFIKQCKFKYGVVVSAPTHKAKKVIERATNLKSFTIQKLLGLRPNTDLDNFDINFPQFDSGAETEIQYFKLLIIDEASMLNTDLYDLICKEANRYNVKVLFIGDALQLPPINEIASKAITDVKNIFELTVIVRQKDTNPLADLLIALRNDILDNTKNRNILYRYRILIDKYNKKIIADQLFEKAKIKLKEYNSFEELLRQNPTNINNNEGYISLEGEQFQEKMREEFTSENYKLNKDYCKYTAWTNDSISGSNRLIRSFLNDTTEVLSEGDVLMGYKTISDKYEGTFIQNSEEYIVESIKKHINNFELDGFEIILKFFDYEQDTYVLNRSLFIVNPNDYVNFLKKHDELLVLAQKYKGKAWTDYYAFKNYNLLLTDIKNNKNKLLVKKDIDYGYGITVHKTQGSTYENIFVNLKNIRMNKDIVERKKLMYVALSRATKKVYIYNKI